MSLIIVRSQRLSWIQVLKCGILLLSRTTSGMESSTPHQYYLKRAAGTPDTQPHSNCRMEILDKKLSEASWAVWLCPSCQSPPSSPQPPTASVRHRLYLFFTAPGAIPNFHQIIVVFSTTIWKYKFLHVLTISNLFSGIEACRNFGLGVPIILQIWSRSSHWEVLNQSVNCKETL